MNESKRLVDIYVDRCIGCTRCMRVCPTEAIRIKDNKVKHITERCIYCGNCILNCHKSAYKVNSDSFANLSRHKINVAILPISVYGMVSNYKELNAIYKTLYDFGFDYIFDLSIVAHLISEKINYMLDGNDHYPYILTQCPTIIRLIQLKFPSLINNLLPFDFPFEIGARIAKKKYSEICSVKEEEIGISYISECLSNFVAIKVPLGKKQSNVDNVFLFSDIFKNILVSEENKHYQIKASKKGIQFGKVGAIKETTNIEEYISVDGINHVSEVLEKLYLNALPKVKLIEAFSCVGGCVGGNFTLENTFVSKWKINHFYKSIDDIDSDKYVKEYLDYIDINDWYFKEEIKSSDPFKLSDNLNQSIIKMNKINQILKQLPNIDCCACGSPSCRALAEDIVNNLKTIDSCYVLKSNKGGKG